MMNTKWITLPLIFLLSSCSLQETEQLNEAWFISILPSSIRMDPSTNEIIDYRFLTMKQLNSSVGNLLRTNWVFNGERASFQGARGEYVSFQLVLTNNTESPLRGIKIEMPPFKNNENQFSVKPEFFLEWSVQVKTPSTGYPKASIGQGWYPDALIPFTYIQVDASQVRHRWTYPLELPDFNNRIDHQRSMMVWIDQYIPYDNKEIRPGNYSTTISVTIGKQTQEIPIDLEVWDFALPNENKLKASLQHEGFLSSMDENQELEIYQLFKRNRVSLMDPTYKPDLHISENKQVNLRWDSFDKRLTKYFTGEAFTVNYGYNFGPGYGEPIETFILPFNVVGKHGGNTGWPDVGDSIQERQPQNKALFIRTIKEVRDHMLKLYNPEKTEITVYLNGLDESYFPSAWDRMVYYGDMFKLNFPEAHFRIDGSYSEEAMNIVGNSINSWASHTINYNIDEVKKYQDMGIEDWLYGPMLYESKVNSWVGSSTFIDLPLVNDRAISWSSWKYNTYSWISWGIAAGWERAWYDPETWKDTYKAGSDSDPGFTFKKLNGNGLLIYSPGVVPNVDGACPSIRLKTMRNGIQEYEYMRLLAQLEGNKDNSNKIVNSIINQPFGKHAIGNLNVWNYDAAQWDQQRLQMGKLINQAIKNQ